jgi:glutamine cyclotransferase
MPKKMAIKGRTKLFLVLFFTTFIIYLCASLLNGSGSIPIYSNSIVKEYPHDPGAFTQGLVYENGMLYEGTGLYGNSSLRRVELETGRILDIVTLPSWLFGEGLTIWGNKLIQLTWRSEIGLVYDKSNMSKIGDFVYETEGWGITSDERRLIMSDGTDMLHFLDPYSFKEIGQLKVQANGIPLFGLNELEYVNGSIYANVWKTSKIAIISSQTGDVTAWIDLEGITDKKNWKNIDVLNGIAYDKEGDRLFVTGKFWPEVFQIKVLKFP